MNALYGIMVNLGVSEGYQNQSLKRIDGGQVFGAPMVAGVIAERQNWRWVFQYCVIFCSLTLALALFCLEETKYEGITIASIEHSTNGTAEDITKKITEPEAALQVDASANTQGNDPQPRYWIDNTIPSRSHLQRLALITPTPGTLRGFLVQMVWPFIYLYSFPAVTFAAISFGSSLSWFSVLVTTEPVLFSAPPYVFGPIEIGLLAVPALIGSILGSLWGGWFSDMLIVWAAARNNGIHEPEVRLWLSVLPTLLGPAGLLIYGLCTVEVNLHHKLRDTRY